MSMRKITVFLLALLLVATGAFAQLTISGSTGATAYSNVANNVGNVDADQDLVIGYAPFSLALNIGYTHPWLAGSVDSITFGYTLSASQAIGPFTVGGSIASNALTQPVDGSAMTGDYVGDIKAKAAFAATPELSLAVDSLFSGKKAHPAFMAVDLGAVYNPFKWLSLTAGGMYMDKQSVTDDTGYVRGLAAVEGLSFYAKAKVSY